MIAKVTLTPFSPNTMFKVYLTKVRVLQIHKVYYLLLYKMQKVRLSRAGLSFFVKTFF